VEGHLVRFASPPKLKGGLYPGFRSSGSKIGTKGHGQPGRNPLFLLVQRKLPNLFAFMGSLSNVVLPSTMIEIVYWFHNILIISLHRTRLELSSTIGCYVSDGLPFSEIVILALEVER
jgi:hypothetical protein